MRNVLISLLLVTLLVGCQTPPKIVYGEESKEVGKMSEKKSPPNPEIINAAIQGDKKLVELFISKGVDVNTKDYSGKTALMHATDKGNKEMVEFLISKGADVNAKDRDSKTVLMYVSNKEIAELLISKGADVNAKDNSGQTALMIAALIGSKPLSELLISKGLNVNAKSKYGGTVLMCAIQWGHKEMVEFLISKGANVNDKDNNGWTALMSAAQFGHKEILELLISKGADVNAEDSYGNTALLNASNNGNKEIAELLISKGADPKTSEQKIVELIKRKNRILVSGNIKVNPEYAASIAQLMNDEDAEVRIIALEVLNNIGWKEIRREIHKGLRDEDINVQSVACHLLLTHFASEDLPVLVKELSSNENEYVRENVALVLGKIGDPQSIAPLLRQAEREIDPDAQNAMHKALVRLKEPDNQNQYIQRIQQTNPWEKALAIQDYEYIHDLTLLKYFLPLLDDQRDALNVGVSDSHEYIRVCDVVINVLDTVLKHPFSFEILPRKYAPDEIKQAKEILRNTNPERKEKKVEKSSSLQLNLQITPDLELKAIIKNVSNRTQTFYFGIMKRFDLVLIDSKGEIIQCSAKIEYKIERYHPRLNSFRTLKPGEQLSSTSKFEKEKTGYNLYWGLKRHYKLQSDTYKAKVVWNFNKYDYYYDEKDEYKRKKLENAFVDEIKSIESNEISFHLF